MSSRSATRRASSASPAEQQPCLWSALCIEDRELKARRPIDGAGLLGLLAVPHEDADDVVPRLAQQVRGDARINAAGHCEDDARHGNDFRFRISDFRLRVTQFCLADFETDFAQARERIVAGRIGQVDGDPVSRLQVRRDVEAGRRFTDRRATRFP